MQRHAHARTSIELPVKVVYGEKWNDGQDACSHPDADNQTDTSCFADAKLTEGVVDTYDSVDGDHAEGEDRGLAGQSCYATRKRAQPHFSPLSLKLDIFPTIVHVNRGNDDHVETHQQIRDCKVADEASIDSIAVATDKSIQDYHRIAQQCRKPQRSRGRYATFHFA